MLRLVSWKVWLGILFFFALDAGVSQDFSMGGTRPIFLYAYILFAAFLWGGEPALFISLWIGILRDLTGSQILGVETVSVVLWAILLDSLLLKVSRDAPGMKLILPFFYVFFTLMTNLGFSAFLGQRNVSFVLQGIPGAFFTALYTAFLFPWMDALLRASYGPLRSKKQYELFER